MFAILSLLLTLLLSLILTRVATMALMLTGLSRESARFQARSAFSGVGFTTSEAESIVNHPVRRRIVMLLMLLGNVGIATVVATMLASMLQLKETTHQWMGMGILTTGLALLWFVARSRWIERRLNRLISYALRRWTRLEIRDYVAVLHLQNEYAVSEMVVEPADWLTDKSLAELHLPAEGVLVLGVQRAGGHYVGAPTADTLVRADDTLILYGPIRRLEELDRRRKGRRGDRAHAEAIEEHEEILEVQEVMEGEGAAPAPEERPATT